MDNPQHYQPLSHALHHPSYPSVYQSHHHHPLPHNRDHDEEEDEDDDDEGAVQQQLGGRFHDHDHSLPASPHQPNPMYVFTSSPISLILTSYTNQPINRSSAGQQATASDSTEPPKRRPGRPRGSKNRKTRQNATTVKQQQQQDPSTSSQFSEVNAQNQHYYEFQWRVLNLCAEFYGAAEELVVSPSSSYSYIIIADVTTIDSHIESDSTTCHLSMLPYGPLRQSRPSQPAQQR